MDGSYILTLTLIDVATGQTLTSASDFFSSTAEMLQGLCPLLSGVLESSTSFSKEDKLPEFEELPDEDDETAENQGRSWGQGLVLDLGFENPGLGSHYTLGLTSQFLFDDPGPDLDTYALYFGLKGAYLWKFGPLYAGFFGEVSGSGWKYDTFGEGYNMSFGFRVAAGGTLQWIPLGLKEKGHAGFGLDLFIIPLHDYDADEIYVQIDAEALGSGAFPSLIFLGKFTSGMFFKLCLGSEIVYNCRIFKTAPDYYYSTYSERDQFMASFKIEFSLVRSLSLPQIAEIRILLPFGPQVDGAAAAVFPFRACFTYSCLHPAPVPVG